MNTTTAWRYHYQAPIKGRKLSLLKAEDLAIALPLLERSIRPTYFLKNRDRLAGELHLDEQLRELIWLDLSKRISKLNSILHIAGSDIIQLELDSFNEQLNRYFSDVGWKYICKELAQLRKREKKARPELSNDVVTRIKDFKERHQLSSYDEAIDMLLNDYEYHNPSSTDPE